MRIDELTKSLEAKSLQQYLQYLKSKNNLKVHNGKFSIVLEPSSGNYVYKVWSLDTAWDVWTKICMQNQDKPFIPKLGKKIYKFNNLFIRRADSHSTINVVKIEKLTPISDDFGTYEMVEDFWKPLLGALQYGRAYLDILDRFRNQYPEFIDFMDNAIDFLQRNVPHNIVLDLHPGNIMMRGNQYVITDPCAISDEISSVYRLPNQMDTAHFLNNTITYDSADYISGKTNSTIPSKSISANNIKVWSDEALIEKYKLTDKDFPKSLFDNYSTITEIISNCTSNDKDILPPTFVKVLYRDCAYVLYYAQQLDSCNLSDDAFFLNSYSVDFFKDTTSMYCMVDFLRSTNAVLDHSMFLEFIERWVDILIDGVENDSNGVTAFSLITPVIAKFDNDVVDMLVAKISEKIDYDNYSWQSVIDDIVFKRNTSKELIALFNQ